MFAIPSRQIRFQSNRPKRWAVALSVVVTLTGFAAFQRAAMCQSDRTLHEILHESDVVAICRLNEGVGREEAATRQNHQSFEMIEILKWESTLPMGETLNTYLADREASAETFLIYGDVDDEEQTELDLSRAYEISESGIDYLKSLPSIGEDAVARLSFYYRALQHQDKLVVENAHLEFALASDEDFAQAAKDFDEDELLGWIENVGASRARNKLYWAMLIHCATLDGVDRIGQLIEAGEVPINESMLTCYLMLVGESALDWIDQSILDQTDFDYVTIYQALIAMRYVGSHSSSPIARPRVIQSMRKILEKPTLADLVIPDLVRLQDWESRDQIAQLYSNADGESEWVRIPAINYMRACPLPDASDYLREFEEIDPRAVERAHTFFQLIESSEEEPPIKLPNIRPRGRGHFGPFC